ncbi:MAG: class I SAM-dependent methyltransferase [Candidatus Curtissbacteria bacterium]|nr:class I SAM-dependent methyltransferase [Candidatus Curtissbacteria bacterium]
MNIKKLFVASVKALDLGSALAVRLTKLTGKSKVPIHPKHLLTQKPWFTKYLKSSDIVLDLGCGNGQNSIKASKIVKKVVGLELSGELLNLAKESFGFKRIKNIKFEMGNLEERLKYKDQAFDKVIFLDVLEHLIKRGQALSEAKRVLKNGGLLFLGVPNSETSWKKLQRSVGINSFSDPDHKIEFREGAINNLLNKEGFEIIKFGYGKYDIPARGLVDIIGGFSLYLYRIIDNLRASKAQENPKEASGFEIVAKKI